jgi:hypothetical protein
VLVNVTIMGSTPDHFIFPLRNAILGNPMVQWGYNSSATVRMWDRPTQGIHISLREKPGHGCSIFAKLQVRVSLCGRFFGFREGGLSQIIDTFLKENSANGFCEARTGGRHVIRLRFVLSPTGRYCLRMHECHMNHRLRVNLSYCPSVSLWPND